VHSREYYRRAYELFQPRGECVLLLAEYQGEPLSALIVFTRGKRAWYFYGASGNAHRERMPAYLLQWEAIRWARAHGCISYDYGGCLISMKITWKPISPSVARDYGAYIASSVVSVAAHARPRPLGSGL